MPIEFTYLEADIFQQTIESYFKIESKLDSLIFDFAKTTFIDSSGIVGLRKIFQSAQAFQIKLIG
jgi:anti-anti-sigma regulatory factor